MNIYASQTYYGKNENFSLQVARGLIPGHSVVTVFGYNPDVDTSEESVWPNGGTVPHPLARGARSGRADGAHRHHADGGGG